MNIYDNSLSQRRSYQIHLLWILGAGGELCWSSYLKEYHKRIPFCLYVCRRDIFLQKNLCKLLNTLHMHLCALPERVLGDEFQVCHQSQAAGPAIKNSPKSDISMVFTDADIYLWDSISINQMAMNKTSFNSSGMRFQLQKWSITKSLCHCWKREAKKDASQSNNFLNTFLSSFISAQTTSTLCSLSDTEK